MQIIDLTFDNNQGDVKADLVKGIITIVVSETNPQFPGGLNVNIPLDPFFGKLQAQAPNWFVKEAEVLAQDAIDDVT